MKRPLIYSLILHAVVLVFLMVGFYNPFRKPMAEQRPIMIEFVTVSDITQAPVIAPQDVQEPEMVQEAPQQEPQPQQPQPEPVQPQPQPEPPKPQPAPEPPKPEPKQEPLPEPEAEPIPTLEPKKPEPKPEPPKEEKKPEEKKKEEPKKEKEKALLDHDKTKPKPTPKVIDEKAEKKKIDKAFDDLLSDVAKDPKDEFSDILNDTAKKDNKSKKKSSGRSKGAPADKVGNVVTASEVDAIRAYFAKCWHVPNGVQGAKNLAVRINTKLNRDGTVKSASIVDKGKLGDKTYRSVAESAERAALDPKCSAPPVDLAKYEEWKDMNITFDPENLY